MLIANPVAQSGAGQAAALQAAEQLREGLGRPDMLDLVFTKAKGHAKDYIATNASRYSTVIALGGDGIIHEVANGLMDPRCSCRRLGIIPVGSGNDYARTLGMSQKVDKAVSQILKAELRPMDLGVCNGEYFTETLSFGLDAAIALGTMERRKKSGKHGTMLYLEEGIDQMLHHMDNHPFSLELREGPDADGSIRCGQAILLALQVGPTYGGGFRICPWADPGDGLLDICVAHGPVRKPKAILTFLSAKNGHHVKSDIVEFMQASRLSLTFDDEPKCQIDGEEHLAKSFDVYVAHEAIEAFIGD